MVGFQFDFCIFFVLCFPSSPALIFDLVFMTLEFVGDQLCFNKGSLFVIWYPLPLLAFLLHLPLQYCHGCSSGLTVLSRDKTDGYHRMNSTDELTRDKGTQRVYVD